MSQRVLYPFLGSDGLLSGTYQTCRRSNKQHFWQQGCKQGAKHALFWSGGGGLSNQLCAVAPLESEMKSKDLEMGAFKIYEGVMKMWFPLQLFVTGGSQDARAELCVRIRRMLVPLCFITHRANVSARLCGQQKISVAITDAHHIRCCEERLLLHNHELAADTQASLSAAETDKLGFCALYF